jgi:1-deoxy-D-xylulose-5-phosphate synthase
MIKNVYDLRRLAPAQLPALAADLRTDIIDVVSARGGHLASSLGVVELTIALHYVFDTPVDTLIWDVGHQAYAHKLLTGRREEFKTLRSYQGLSGFPKICESEFDRYNAGHSSTSISLALGEAAARDLDGKRHRVVAIIGDGALSGGMAFEALNQMGEMEKDVIIILNDNEHSISRNVGALSNYLNRIISDPLYNQMRKTSHTLLSGLPGPLGRHVSRIFDRTEANLKHLFVPGQLFEDLGLRYFGPVDGHDLNSMVELLQRVRSIDNGPKIVHVITSKGRGYVPAEKNPSLFHGIGPFDRESGLVRKSPLTSYSEIVGQTLTGIACQDQDIVTITAAMASGTGLDIFAGRHPERFFDVGIAEQHALTFAAAMARNGKKPFVSVYSTFLQRAYDQIIHDIAIMNLPVRILIDRAGIVGEDGETHHGLFDISFMKNIPNFRVLSPASGEELKNALYFAGRIQ